MQHIFHRYNIVRLCSKSKIAGVLLNYLLILKKQISRQTSHNFAAYGNKYTSTTVMDLGLY